ncbi:licodione synthase-like [Abrus precatorius]|uniref:Licodione synthase-like n=1 Tax=Abrus precatorius TaxID=3816 RepID=A0A8B8KWF2_ABRPR|nr:licodione synthase-like [Abrus precatorius]
MDLQFCLISFLLASLLLYFLSSRNSRQLPPSPRLRLPIIGHMHLLGPLLHQSFHRLSLSYGPLFSLHLGSVPCVFVSSPHFAKQFLQNNELAFSCRIVNNAVKCFNYECSLAFAPYGDYWRFMKKLCMNELLSSRSVNNFQHLRAQETRRLIRLLTQKAKACEAVNVTEELLKLTNSIISRMMLGEVEEVCDVVRDVTQIFGEFNISDFIWLFKNFDIQGFGKRTEELYQKYDTLVERVISKREEMRKNKAVENGGSGRDEAEFRDFLDILLDCAQDQSAEVKINRSHIKALVMDFFAAGTDTTSISTEWALVELIKNPSSLKQAREEIDNVVGKNRLVEESDCANLPYLQAIVKEAYRIHPPVPLVVRRCVTECKIENYVIPKDALVFVNVWAIGRDPNNWDNPLEFRPERFLNLGEGDSTPMDVRGQHFQLLPFGSGRRMCPGVNLAMQLVPALLGAIIQCFDFQVMDSKGVVLKGDNMVIDVDERPGLTAPRAHDLEGVPVERFGCKPLEMLGS